MYLNYKEFVDLVRDWISGTTVQYSGITYKMSYIKELDSKDRIAGTRNKHYPACFITPMAQITQKQYGESTYGVRLYFADHLSRDRSNYYTVMNNLTMFIQAMWQQIPKEYSKMIYPTTFNVPLSWDDMVEGFYVDFQLTASNHCYGTAGTSGFSGITGYQGATSGTSGAGTSGESGSSGTSGTSGGVSGSSGISVYGTSGTSGSSARSGTSGTSG